MRGCLRAASRWTMQLGHFLPSSRKAALWDTWPSLSNSHFCPVSPGHSWAPAATPGGWQRLARTCLAAAVTQMTFLGLYSPAPIMPRKSENQAGRRWIPDRGTVWTAWEREQFLLLSHSSRASHIAGSYEAAQGDWVTPWGTKLRGLSLILRSVNMLNSNN